MPHSRYSRALTLVSVCVVVSLGLAAPAAAQRRGGDRAPRTDRPEEAGRGYFQVGYLAVDTDALNSSLVNAGLPTVSDDFLTLGGGGLGRVGERVLVGGEGHGILGESATGADGGYRVSAGGGYGLFRIGYEALSYRGFDLIGLVGVGGGGLSVDITGRSAPTFDEVLENPARSSSLSTGMFLLDASIAASYRVRLPAQARRGGEEGGFLLGLHTGYTFQPGGSSWDLDGINGVAGGPDFQIEGFYVRFSIGGWGVDDAEDGERGRGRR